MSNQDVAETFEIVLAALKAVTFRFGVVVLATGDFSDVNAQVIDVANAAIAKAEGK